jgi:uncharacterized protein YecE (DUF72 family)
MTFENASDPIGMMETRIGISGWRYKPWRGVFYPKGLLQKDELSFASRQMNSIEINGTFYAQQNPKSFTEWYLETPDDFIFSVKCPRFITHMKKLRNVEAPLGNFFGSGVFYLQEKLGPFLWQLPPMFTFRDDVLENFFRLLPRTFGEAIEISQWADRVIPDFPRNFNLHTELRHAIEVRHDSFENPDFIELLREHNISLVIADTAGRWPYMEDITSDFLYIRLHGGEEIYSSGYGEESLQWWAERIMQWQKGETPKDTLTMSEKIAPPRPRDVYVYFDNDIKVRAPYDARRLSELLDIKNIRYRSTSGTRKELDAVAQV